MKERCKCTFVRTVMISVQYRTIAKFANKTYIPNISMHSKRTIANVMCVCVCVRAIVAEKFEGQRTKQSAHRILFLEFSLSLNIVPVIKSRRMRWAGHVARMGEERGRIGSWWGNRRERYRWGDLGIDGWIILGWISMRWDVGMWTGLGWHRIGTGCGRL